MISTKDLALLRQLDRTVADLVQAFQFYKQPIAVIPIIHTFAGANSPELVLPANPGRVKMFPVVNGAGTLWLSTKQEPSANLGIPLVAGNPYSTFMDDWPWVHKGEWWAQVSAVTAILTVVEYSLVVA